MLFDMLLAYVLLLKYAIQFIFLKCYFNECNGDSVNVELFVM